MLQASNFAIILEYIGMENPCSFFIFILHNLVARNEIQKKNYLGFHTPKFHENISYF